MSKLNYDSEQIQRYLLKEMSERETKEFESQMAKDPNLKAEVSQAFVLHQIVIEKRLFEVNDLLKEISSAKPRKGKGPIIGGALGILTVLIGISYFVFRGEDQSNTQKVRVESNEQIRSDEDFISDGRELANESNSPEVTKVENKAIKANSISHAPNQSHEVRLTPQNVQIETEAPNKELSIENTPEIDSSATEKVREEQPNVENLKISDPCQNKSWQLDLDKSTSCMGKNSGEIIVSSVLQDLEYAIDDEDPSSVHEWTDLASGNYRLHIVDDSGCDTNLMVTIEASVCREKGNDYEFYIGNDEVVRFTELDNRSGQIQILNQRGVEQKVITFEEGYPSEWEIRSEFDMPLEVGFLTYFIRFNDGDMLQGGITVLP